MQIGQIQGILEYAMYQYKQQIQSFNEISFIKQNYHDFQSQQQLKQLVQFTKDLYEESLTVSQDGLGFISSRRNGLQCEASDSNYENRNNVQDSQQLTRQTTRQLSQQKWMNQYNKILSFVNTFKCLPKDSNNSHHEKLLAKWVQKQRSAFHKLQQEQQNLMLQLTDFQPVIKQIDTRPFEDKLRSIKTIYDDIINANKQNMTSNNTINNSSLQQIKLTQKILGNGLYQFLKKTIKQYKENQLDQYHKQIFEQIAIPLDSMKSFNCIWQSNLDKFKLFYQQYKALPKQTGQYKDIGKFIVKQQKKWNSLNQAKKDLLLSVYPNINQYQIKQKCELQFKLFIQEHKRLPKYNKNNQQETSLHKWVTRNKEKSTNIFKSLTNNNNNQII